MGALDFIFSRWMTRSYVLEAQFKYVIHKHWWLNDYTQPLYDGIRKVVFFPKESNSTMVGKHEKDIKT